MFDLNSAVADWKSQMSAGGTCSRADLDELESHLGDSVDRLVSAGLSEEEAFLLSLRRLGQPDRLRVEYAKANPERVWRERAAWMFTGLVAWNALSAISIVVSNGGLVVAAAIGARGLALATAEVFAGLLGLIIAASGAFFLYRRAARGGVRFPSSIWVAAGVTMILIGHFVSPARNMLLIKLMKPSEYGPMVITHSIYYFTTGLLTPLAFAFLAIRLHRSTPEKDC